jgi:hypothetical protein
MVVTDGSSSSGGTGFSAAGGGAGLASGSGAGGAGWALTDSGDAGVEELLEFSAGALEVVGVAGCLPLFG